MMDWIQSLPLVPAVLVLMVVIYCRAGGTYALGRGAHTLTEGSRLRRFLEGDAVERARGRIARWGAPIVALSFLTVGFQTAANAAAGLVKMPLSRYLPALAIGGFIWSVLYATVGLAAFSLWWSLLVGQPIVAAGLIAVVVCLIWLAISRRRIKRKRQESVPQD